MSPTAANLHPSNPDSRVDFKDVSGGESQALIDSVRKRLNEAIKGKPDVIENVLACLLARGHLLIEDLPGLGKTTLAKNLSQSIGASYARVQCTPDLLPGDITGFNIFNAKTREFEFLPGPVFSEFLLADEINRATPRSQSALLEAMAERQVTVDNTRHRLSEAFFVIATQNPVEHHGTYPLPEAQLDRFAMKLRMGYPDPEFEEAMLAADLLSAVDSEQTGSVLHIEDLQRIQTEVSHVTVAPALREYLVALAGAIRKHPQVKLGLSPRGVLIWQRISQAWAWLKKRNFVTPDDIQQVALPVLEVRIGLGKEISARVVREAIESISVPVNREK